MIYHLIWKRDDNYGSGTVHTWDGKIVDTTPALASLVGRPYSAVDAAANRLGAKLTLETENGNDRIVLRYMEKLRS